ncbi:MAG: adhesin transport system membrane fusion protein [Motiliproteus sp.]|jgi:adhesin transport system membrane fusion protein
MLFDRFFAADGAHNSAVIKRLETYHERRLSPLLLILLLGMGGFFYWASHFVIDEVARATGEVITSSRVQVIQAVDGGVLSSLKVREGDRVEEGQILAKLDDTRFEALVNEIVARLSALKAKEVRLRAEITQAETLEFPEDLLQFPGLIEVETALFQLRRDGLSDEIKTLQTAIKLSDEEVRLVQELAGSGDVNRSEVIRTERMLNDAEAKLIVRKNSFFEESSSELTRVEDNIAQNEQILTQRTQQLQDSIFVAQVAGVVKNISVTTVGGVLRAGEELMQIIPVDDVLLIEAKISPEDISRVRTGHQATLRFDPFDYTIFGGVMGEVVYVSADTLKEDTRNGEEIYYRAHIKTPTSPAVTTTGRELEIQPGMTAQVDIRTGRRTVMEYLLKPLRKTLTESFGER